MLCWFLAGVVLWEIFEFGASKFLPTDHCLGTNNAVLIAVFFSQLLILP